MRRKGRASVESLVISSSERIADRTAKDADGKVRLTFLRRQPTQARGMRSVLEILKACECLLGEKQPDEITIELIATRAKVQAGSIFFFFNDRLSIFFSVIELALRELAAQYDFHEDEFALSMPEFLLCLDGKLLRIWDIHRTVMDLYFAYQAHPAIRPILDECIGYMNSQLARKMAAEFKTMKKERRSMLALVINQQLIHGHDVMRTLPKAKIAAFRQEWGAVLFNYINAIRA